MLFGNYIEICAIYGCYKQYRQRGHGEMKTTECVIQVIVADGRCSLGISSSNAGLPSIIREADW